MLVMMQVTFISYQMNLFLFKFRPELGKSVNTDEAAALGDTVIKLCLSLRILFDYFIYCLIVSF